MKRSVCVPFATLLLVAMASAQMAPAAKQSKPSTPPTLTTILDSNLNYPEHEIVPAADAMPEAKYNFAPTNGDFKGVRTFAQQVKHIAAANYMFAAAILEEKPPVELGGENGPDAITSKADIMKFLKDSFAYAHRAYQSINEHNAYEQVKSPFGPKKISRLSLAILNVAHPFDHYGQMVEYLRMNDIIPPASRK